MILSHESEIVWWRPTWSQVLILSCLPIDSSVVVDHIYITLRAICDLSWGCVDLVTLKQSLLIVVYEWRCWSGGCQGWRRSCRRWEEERCWCIRKKIRIVIDQICNNFRHVFWHVLMSIFIVVDDFIIRGVTIIIMVVVMRGLTKNERHRDQKRVCWVKSCFWAKKSSRKFWFYSKTCGGCNVRKSFSEKERQAEMRREEDWMGTSDRMILIQNDILW